MMSRDKALYGENFKDHEFYSNMKASLIGGAVGSGVTNCLDVITINKQANPDLNIRELIKKERFGLFSKGIMARV